MFYIPQIRLDNHVNSYSEIIPSVHCNFLSLLQLPFGLFFNFANFVSWHNIGYHSFDLTKYLVLKSFSGGRIAWIVDGPSTKYIFKLTVTLLSIESKYKKIYTKMLKLSHGSLLTSKAWSHPYYQDFSTSPFLLSKNFVHFWENFKIHKLQ